MIHVSDAHSRYAETLAALQLGSRVHRLRRSRRLKVSLHDLKYSEKTRNELNFKHRLHYLCIGSVDGKRKFRQWIRW